MNNSEILFLYDAKLTNPNGDPDEENRPRMDYEREINLVSDLRLKRYIRDYLEMQGHSIYVRQLEGKSVTPVKILEKLAEKLGKTSKELAAQEILKELTDVRLFGATMPIEGEMRAFTGPVQFNWGHSLNKVELLEAGITTHFASDEKNNQGSMGRDFRVKYSFIAFAGIISGKRAGHTLLNEKDVEQLDLATVKSIPMLATRSKVGQYPRLYVRLEYVDDETVLGDMRNLVVLNEEKENPRDISEITIDVAKLKEHLNVVKDRIKTVHYFADSQLRLVDGEVKPFEEIFCGLNLRKIG